LTEVPCHTPVPIVPTLVSEEPVIPEPNVVDDKTSVLLILNTLPLAIFQFSLEVQLVPVVFQLIVLSVVPLTVIPPPLAVLSVAPPNVKL